MHSIAITNQKGGVGKTTTAVNLCASLAVADKKVLLIDLDPQGNATVSSGLAMRDLETSVYEVLLGISPASNAIVPTVGDYDLLPARPDLAGAQVEIADNPRRDFLLADALKSIGDKYNIIIIDCPPSMNVLTVNSLTAADQVLIPVQCEYFALEGLSSLMQTIDIVRNGLNPRLKILGLVRTLVDARTVLAMEVDAQLTKHFPKQLFRTVVPRNIRLAEAPSHGLPVLQYDRTCAGAQAYLALASEILRQLNKT